MKRLVKPLVWTLLFLVMMLAIDQFLVQVPPVNPAHKAISDFYRDFRTRIIDLLFGGHQAGPGSIEAVIDKEGGEKRVGPAPAGKVHGQGKPTTGQQSKAKRRYLYSDARGELQFADSLEEVPKEFRAQAQPMGE